MRVLLISPNREELNMPTWPLGLACVGAAIRKGRHDVSILDLMNANEPRKELESRISGFHPEVIGLSVRNIDDQNMENPTLLLDHARDVIAWCRELSDAPLVLGGAGYSIYPDSALKYLAADMGIQGEGEVMFPAVLQRIRNKEDLSGLPGLFLAGLGSQGRPIPAGDLDQLPLPEPDLLSAPTVQGEEFWFPVQTRRGCPMNCNYCSTATIEGIRFRKRTPELVVRWISRWVEAGFSRLYFVDNTFNRPESYAEALCSELSRAAMNLTWRCIVYPGKIGERLVRLMSQTGCSEVALGFESGSERILRVMNKRFTPEQVRRMSRLFGDHGIRRIGFLLLGGPGETKQSVEESLAFADSLTLETVKVTVGIRIYPYTELAKTAVDHDLIMPDDDLLLPRYYLAPGLDGWIQETVREWMAVRPNWVS